MKKGFTLIELLVYMALIGIVVLIAGQAFSDSVKFRVRSQNMLKTSETSSKVAGIVKEDMAQMGSKSWKSITGTSDPDIFYVDEKVYVDPDNADASLVDSSSYVLTRSGDGRDSIAFRKMEYTDQGVFVGVRSVSWYVADSTLWRSCQTLSGTENDDCPTQVSSVVPVKMAEKVARFSLNPGRPGATSASSEVLFPASSSSGFRLVARYGTDDIYRAEVDPDSGGTTETVSGFSTNYNSETATSNLTGKKANQVFLAPAVSAGATSGTWASLCTEFTFLPEETYAFEFNLLYLENNMRMFRPEVDHIAVGLRKKSSADKISGLEDFMIYPPQASDASTLRYGEFSVADTTQACMAVTFAFYSPLANGGSLEFSNFKVYRKTEDTYHFVETSPGKYSENPTAGSDKRRVKAFQLELAVARRGEVGRVQMIVPTPDNGVAATATPTSSSSSP